MTDAHIGVLVHEPDAFDMFADEQVETEYAFFNLDEGVVLVHADGLVIEESVVHAYPLSHYIHAAGFPLGSYLIGTANEYYAEPAFIVPIGEYTMHRPS